MTERTTETELALLRQDMDVMKEDVKSLVEAWKAANNVLSFIKWLSGLGVAVAAFWAIIKGKLGV
jgi:hypothetical protein